MTTFGIGLRAAAGCVALVGALVASALAMNGEWLGFAAGLLAVALLAHAAGRGRDPVQRHFPAPPGARAEPVLRLAAGCLTPAALYFADTAFRIAAPGMAALFLGAGCVLGLVAVFGPRPPRASRRGSSP